MKLKGKYSYWSLYSLRASTAGMANVPNAKFLVKHFTNCWTHTTSSLSKKTKCVLSPEKRQNKDQNKSTLIEPKINLVYFLATQEQDEYYLQ